MIERPILFVHPNGGGHRPSRICATQLTIGPYDDLHLWDGSTRPIRTPLGRFDLKADVLNRVPEAAAASTLVVWITGPLSLPRGTKNFPGKRVLIVGDTHHIDRSLEIAIAYAAAEEFDVVLVGVRHHAHWLRAAGIQNVYWLPPTVPGRGTQSFVAEKHREILMIGQLGSEHPRRRRCVQALVDHGYPVRVHSCSMDEAMKQYASSLITLNVSLNGDPNMRLFDVPAAGGCLLTDRLSPLAGLSQHYVEGEHYLAFDDVEELCQKIDQVLAHPDVATSIGKQALSRYSAIFDPDVVSAQFWAVVDEGRVHPPYDLRLEPRFAAAMPSNLDGIQNDLAIYQAIQECQRVQEAPDVLILPGFSSSIASYCADLPRVRFRCLADDLASWSMLSPKLPVAPIQSIDQAEASRRQWDLVVGPDSGDQAATLFAAARWIMRGPSAVHAWLTMDARVQGVRRLAPDIVEMVARSDQPAPDAAGNPVVNFMSEYFDTSFGQVHLWRRPRALGPLIFAVHGFVRDGRDLFSALSLLAPSAELVLLDLPGHGGTLACADMNLSTLSSMVMEYLQAVARQRPVILLGDGIGALVVAAAAKHLKPEAVLLLDPPLSTAKQWWAIDAIREKLPFSTFTQLGQLARDVLGVSAEEVVEKDYLRSLLTPPPEGCFILTGGEPLWPRRAITTVPPSSLDDEDIARIEHEFGASLPVLRIPGAGYSLMNSAPLIVADLLGQILRQL